MISINECYGSLARSYRPGDWNCNRARSPGLVQMARKSSRVIFFTGQMLGALFLLAWIAAAIFVAGALMHAEKPWQPACFDNFTGESHLCARVEQKPHPWLLP